DLHVARTAGGAPRRREAGSSAVRRAPDAHSSARHHDRAGAMSTVPVVRFVVAGVDTQSPAPSLGRPYTVVYDGHCKVCTRLSRALQSWDTARQFEVVPSQAPGVQARFPWIPARAYAESLQVI